jgi:hypothetical protein
MHLRPYRIWIAEAAWFLLLLIISLHFLAERIDTRSIPHGDEGSWMSVAAELSNGNGFTTRWLEHGFLKPYTLPRPDDYRYPALSLLLAAAFTVIGTSYTVALWCVALVFLLFGSAVYLVVKKRFGTRTACATLPLVYCSLLQLMYASEVYSEGLFGIGVALVAATSIRFNTDKPAWWYLTGAAIGALYLIRPNAILFAIALLPYALWLIAKRRISWRPVVLSFGIMTLIMLPWCIRSYLHFGNPFHLAGSAGLLRARETDTLTLSFLQFTEQYGIFYFLKAALLNTVSFFRVLHEQEHGLELIPLVFCLIGAVRRSPFFNGFVVMGFALSFIACCYTSVMGNWAGVRYFSPFLPFVYAYGVSQIIALTDRILKHLSPRLGTPLAALSLAVIFGLLVAPVYYPHRYYERYYSQASAGNRNFSEYYTALGRHLNGRSFYYAGSLAQINFATSFNCIGMQQYFDGKEITRAQKTFKPALMALTKNEITAPYFIGLMVALKNSGYSLTPIAMPDSFALFVMINR